MPREKQCFRDNMARLNEIFPDREMLRICDVMKVTGRSRNTVKKYYTFKNREVSKADLARQMSL